MAAAATMSPRTFTTGYVGMYNGTKDGGNPFIDFKDNSTNTKPADDVPIKVDDMRYMTTKPTFASHGYEYRNHTTKMTPEQFATGRDSAENTQFLKDNYMTEVVEIVKKVTGGAVVIPNEFRLRNQVADGRDYMQSKATRGTVNIVHVDRDPCNVESRLALGVGEERANELLTQYKGKKWATVNVWRPIGETVGRWPLVFVNHDAVPDWDYHPYMVDIASRNDPGITGVKGHETILKNDPRYAFHYLSSQAVDEVLVFASYHSDPKKVVPHSAFWDDNTATNAPPRRSIEARCWVFWDEEE